MAYRNPGAFLSFLSHQARVHVPIPSKSFAGQTIIITGSNTGLGLEAAIHIVRLGAERVILAVRSISKGEEAKKHIEEKTKRTNVADVWELDLASYDSVKAFVKKAEGLPRLDAVLENAGILSPTFKMAETDEYVLVS
jgi:retinol dehydrogenase-12